MMSEKDLDERWIDMDAWGKFTTIMVSRSRKMWEIYDPDGIFYLE